jgi:hypothetical protein
MAAAAHIFHKPGSKARIEGREGIVKKFLEDFDVALIELHSGCRQRSLNLAMHL